MRYTHRFPILFGLLLLLVAAALLFFIVIPMFKGVIQPVTTSTVATVMTATPLVHDTATSVATSTTVPSPASVTSSQPQPIWQIVAGVIAGIIALLVAWLGQAQRRKPTKAHGSAHWATVGEIWQDCLVLTRWRERRTTRRALAHGQCPPSFLPLGTYKGMRLALSERQQESHISIIAPTGKGKTTTMIIPALLQEHGHRSLFLNDTKGELALKTWGALAEQHTCYQFAPTKPTRSHCYNPLSHVQAMDDAEDLATCLIANTGHSNDQFWDNAAGLLLTSVILHLRRTETEPPFHRLIDLLCGTPAEEVKTLLATSPSALVRKVSVSFISAVSKNERLEGAVFTELASRLFRMHNPSIVAVTSTNEIDFPQIITEPSALFLHIPQGDVERLKWLSATLVMQLMKALIKTAQDRPLLRLDRSFVFYLDEFCNAGHIPHFTEHISLVRSAGIAYILAMQDFGQLEREYGEQGKATILSNTTHKLFFPGCGLEEARYASELAGDTTVMTYSESDRNATTGGYIATGQRSLTSSETHRRLLTPDEIRRLPKGTALLFSDTTPPIRLKVTSYLNDRTLLTRTQLPYIPPQGPTIKEEEDIVSTPMPAATPLSAMLPVPDEE